MAKLEPVVPDVWRWTWFSEEKGMNFNGYLVRLPDQLVLIDPVYGDESVWKAIEAIGTPTRILVTNKDHERASHELRGRFKARVLAHEDEIPHFAEKPEEPFREEGPVLGHLQAIRFKQLKSPAECSFYWKARRLLFVGDAVTGHPAGRLGLVKKHEGRPEVKQELRRLLDHDFDALLPGDGEPILEGAKAALQRFVEAAPEA